LASRSTRRSVSLSSISSRAAVFWAGVMDLPTVIWPRGEGAGKVASPDSSARATGATMRAATSAAVVRIRSLRMVSGDRNKTLPHDGRSLLRLAMSSSYYDLVWSAFRVESAGIAAFRRQPTGCVVERNWRLPGALLLSPMHTPRSFSVAALARSNRVDRLGRCSSATRCRACRAGSPCHRRPQSRTDRPRAQVEAEARQELRST
jgi:hypothetical protein